jgi:hypothetical protein
MLKRVILTTSLLSSIHSFAWEMPAIPSLKEQYENAKIDELTEFFESDPYFAGKLVSVDIFGKKVTVDRTREPNATPKGTPPPQLSVIGITDILNGLSAESKAQVGVNVERKWNDQGVLIMEKWGIVVGGEAKIKKEELTPPKEGKTTGEGQ